MKLEQDKYELELENEKFRNYSRNIGISLFLGLVVGLSIAWVIHQFI